MTDRRTQIQRGRLLAAAVVVVLLVLAAPVSATVAGLEVGTGCAAAADTDVRVGVVVDFGMLKAAGDPGAIVATCVPVPERTNGVKILEASGHTVRVDSSGLLCAIDGLPAEPQCGDRTSGGYRYWAYFHGSGSAWAYSSVGPGGSYAKAGLVEGWHFVDGAGNPTDPPPGRAPTNLCPVTPPPTAAPPPTTAAPIPTTAPAAAPTTGAPAGGGTSSGGPSPSGASATTAAPGAPTPTTTAPGDAGTPATDEGDGPPGTDAAASGEGAGPTGTGPSTAEATDVTILAAAQLPADDGDVGGPPVGTLVAVVLIAAVGGAAAWRLRGRTDAGG